MPRTNKLSPEERKTKRTEYLKNYYLSKREEIMKKKLVKHDCNICFGAYTPSHRSEHLRSAKHLKALEIRSQLESQSSPETVSIDLKDKP